MHTSTGPGEALFTIDIARTASIKCMQWTIIINKVRSQVNKIVSEQNKQFSKQHNIH